MLFNILNFIDKLNDLSDQFRKAIMDHAKTGPFENPIFWIGAICLGLAVFAFTYNALHKDS